MWVAGAAQNYFAVHVFRTVSSDTKNVKMPEFFFR